MLKFKTLLVSTTILVLIFINSCAQGFLIKNQPKENISIQQQIDILLKNPSLDPAFIGIYIEELGTSTIVYNKNEHKLLMPASNMKLVTTASALSILKPDYQYLTKIYSDGEIKDSVLEGNLIIKGSGDPVICGRFYDDNPDSIFTLWAQKLAELGISKINGNIIGDNSLFQDDGLGYGWEKDDLPYYYAAKTSALSFNDNCIDFHISPGKNCGDSVTVKQLPVNNYLEIDNQLITVHSDSSSSTSFTRNFIDGKLYLKGQIPINSETKIDWTTVPDPADFFLKAFTDILLKNGISFNQYSICSEKPNYKDKTLLHVHKSVPLKKIAHNINKISNNFYTEMVLKTICKDQNITTSKAIKAEKKFLASIGIDTDRMFIMDGSGLSRHNMVTVHQIATILKYMHSSENGAIFKETLPIAGIDGTLKRRLKGSNAIGHVFAKTGYVGHVRALSGYVEAKNGKEYVFSIIANHYPTPTSVINNLQDHIVTILYNHEN